MTRLTRYLLLAVLLSCSSSSFAQKRNRAKVRTPSPTTVTGQVISGWVEFSSDKGKFTVLMPGVPTEEVTTIDSAVGKLNMHMFMLTSSPLFMVMYADYPLSLEEPNIVKSALDGGRDEALKNVKGQLLEEKDITYQGHPGRYLKVKGGNGFIVRSNIIIVANRAYTLAHMTTDEESKSATQIRLHEETATKFLESFKLTDTEETPTPE